MGFLGFALKCFDFLAWPLISLGYPLCASVRAIEANSNSDMQKLITYWILYSLISLFELGFSKLIEWIPFWPCIKLMAISYLVQPRFHGAYHVYGCLVHPYFHVNPQVVINKFNKLKELSHNGENFLAMADKYVEENGLEALVKLIASQSKGTKPSYDVGEIKVVSNAEKREVVATIQSKCKDPIVVQKDIRAVEQIDKNTAAAAKSKCKDPVVVQKDIKVVEQTEKNAAAAAKVKNGEQKIAYAEKKTDATVGIKQTTATSVGVGENKLPEVTTSKNILKEWNCAVCQSTCSSEKDLNSHLRGRKHRAKCKELKACKQTEKNKGTSSSTANTSVGGGENKLPEVTTSKNILKEWTCAVCQSTCNSEKDLNSHLRGRKHRAKCKELKASKQTEKNKGTSSSTANKSFQTNQEPGKHKRSQVNSDKQIIPKNAGTQLQQSKFWCSICNVRCYGEINLASHLNGRKHSHQVQVVEALGTWG